MDLLSAATGFTSPAQALALLAEVKRNVKLAQTLGACGFAICLWDTLAYLHQEYRLVWQAKPSPLKIAYLYTRYATILFGIVLFIGFFVNFSPDTCSSYAKAIPAMGTLPILGCTSILIFRAYTLWERNKAMLVFMAILAALQEVGMLAASLTQTKAVPTIPGHVTVCVPYSTTTLSLLYWIFPTIAHSFIFLFSFVRAWEGVHVQHSQAMTASKLYKVMISSYGLLFMASIIVIELTQIFFWLAADSMLKAVCSPLSGFVITVLACQMVLVLKLTTQRGLSGEPQDSGSMPSLPHIRHPHKTSRALSGLQVFVQSHQHVDVARSEVKTKTASISTTDDRAFSAITPARKSTGNLPDYGHTGKTNPGLPSEASQYPAQAMINEINLDDVIEVEMDKDSYIHSSDHSEHN